MTELKLRVGEIYLTRNGQAVRIFKKISGEYALHSMRGQLGLVGDGPINEWSERGRYNEYGFKAHPYDILSAHPVCTCSLGALLYGA